MKPEQEAPRPNRIWHRLVIAASLLAIAGITSLWLAYLIIDRAPGELMRYAERRLIGHPKLESVILPMFKLLRPYIERPVTGPLPTLGKGQQAQALPPQRYSAKGRPLATDKAGAAPPDATYSAAMLLASEAEIQQGIAQAHPGQVLEIAPGTYPMARSIRIHNAGQADRPIILRAKAPGSVIIESTALEGFHLHAPYWIFENLVIRGICKEHSNCEHAFHIVGKARNIVIRNNRIEDFNAQIKVNGLSGDWPDDGLIQFNSLTTSKKRNTARPITPIDIVGADRWQVADNVISNFVKGDGNKVSYGVFMKGASSHGRIDRNLIICTDKDISQPGTRVGLSFGGGGTYPVSLCRDQRCITEHSHGIAVNNIIAHCNDFGIYINKSNQTLIAHNTLINTYGIEIQFQSASATMNGNLMEGLIVQRNAGRLDVGLNERKSLTSVFADPDKLKLEPVASFEKIKADPNVADDFCGRPRQAETLPGAFSQTEPCR
ncbi:MAG: chondroitinase-B domain-containing protein [Rhodocyclaceae bacterium]|nr:chondroitinase-B domain-containing protein [Rhodocyclaceae bacterium]